MKVIKTQITNQDNISNLSTTQTFYIPSFSNILNYFIDQNILYVIYEYDDLYPENIKSISVKSINTIDLYEASDLYKYWAQLKQTLHQYHQITTVVYIFN